MSTIDATCPECSAKYELTTEQLAVAQGQVRCGACLNIFQAVPSSTQQLEEAESYDENLIDDGLQDDKTLDDDGLENLESHIDDSLQDDELLIGDSEEELSVLSEEFSASSGIDRSGEGNFFEDVESVDLVERKADAVDESWTQDLMDDTEEPTTRPKSAAQDASNIDEFSDSITLKPSDTDDIGFDENDKSSLLSRITPEPLEFNVQRDHSAAINLFFSVSIVVLVIFSLLQTLYFQVDTLGRKPEWRKTYTQLCKFTGCVLPKQYSIKDISADSTHQKEHAIYQGALLLETVITNHAKFRQPFPNIDLYFKNMKDEVIAARSFKPSEYLRGAIATSKTMPSRQPIHIALEVNDPGVKATGYELKMSYPK